MVRIGLDIGSTTIKAVVLDENGAIVYQKYERHFARVTEKAAAMLGEIAAVVPDQAVRMSISGSAGMGLADACGIPFVQEVYATRIAVKTLCPGTDAIIELGGEDAKILFLTQQSGDEKYDDLEVRMNGSCAGGTGAFIDQMATLLGVPTEEVNDLAGQAEKQYTIASRCGVFAKSDVQPLLNQGAKKADIAKSIYVAVVNQTIAGLAQGREIKGNVLYLGGPLTFMSNLRGSFDEILGVTGTCPENSLYYVAYGAALMSTDEMNLPETAEKISRFSARDGYVGCDPLFADAAEYAAFSARHAAHTVPRRNDPAYAGRAYIGVDAGSTTVKAVAIDPDGAILFSRYMSNGGNPAPRVREFLMDFYREYPRVTVAGAASTGYGEDMIKNAFQMDTGIVETVAHFTAAKKFLPKVDFIIDIGGQDIKCFKIRAGTIDNIFLNEACSSGCGSFLQTFASAWGHTIEDFAKIGILADKPVDLGSRCTVFMNSSVKQAQKDGATLENISAGLSISVVKNALYKVIRTENARELGENIVVQGGTFLNDAVLRAFEREIGHDVIRPDIAGLMGAYGAALHSMKLNKEKSDILDAAALENFEHTVTNTTCNGCTNHCSLTINRFGGTRRYISGNNCEKPLGGKSDGEKLNLYEYKRELLKAYPSKPGTRGKIGIPMGLNMLELYPFWFTLLTELGFTVVPSPDSTRAMYFAGQHTIPSDTVCYPAKLVHGHVISLIEQGIDTVFYPCLTYNVDEKKSDNHYNCPVVAYYPEIIRANMPEVRKIRFLCDYFGIHRPKDFPKHFHAFLQENFGSFSQKEVAQAAQKAYAEYEAHMERIRAKGAEYLLRAKEMQKPVVILAGRPYHIDPEINHGIDRLITELGAVVVSEDAVAVHVPKFETRVLNQWTYHARMYAAAEYVAETPRTDVTLVQLVSFGCGVDAITTDEVRGILERHDKIYTLIKIDEITNLGAVKIRLRSLFAALGWEGGAK